MPVAPGDIRLLCRVDGVGAGAYRVRIINIEASALKGSRFPH